MMRLSVLGCATPLPRVGNPCSGYLLSDANSSILLDCGSGVFANLLEQVNPNELSGVWISHMHPDHSADLITFSNWALNTPGARKIPVLGPANWDTRLNSFLAESPSDDVVSKIFDVGYIEDSSTVEFGGMKLISRKVVHSVPTYGVRITGGGATFSYSGDTGPCKPLEELAADADLFLCEAGTEKLSRYHLTIEQARDIARKAHVRKLLVTHRPEELDNVNLDDCVQAGSKWNVRE